jgi:hypothetical protein
MIYRCNWVLPIIVGSVLCSAIITLVTTCVGLLEFHQAVWTRFPMSLPLIAEKFKEVYPLGWVLTIATVVLGMLVWTNKFTNAMAISACVSALVVAHVAWFLFALLAVYLTNQSFRVGG